MKCHHLSTIHDHTATIAVIGLALRQAQDKAIAIMLLSKTEKRQLHQRLPVIIGVDQDALEDLGWLHLAETSFTFWEDEEEEIYNDLIPPTSGMLEK